MPHVVSVDDLAEEVDPIANRLGLDVAMLDLHALMDATQLSDHIGGVQKRSVSCIGAWPSPSAATRKFRTASRQNSDLTGTLHLKTLSRDEAALSPTSTWRSVEGATSLTVEATLKVRIPKPPSET